ncbi:MAG: hypothetical protein II064_09245, partial [Bacteroidales bacterium]|nr:hypothetical protein [Bacteroidales bacterium]
MFHALKGTEYKLALGEDSIVDDHIPELMEANNVAVECLKDYNFPPEARQITTDVIFSPMPGGALTANTLMMRETKTFHLFPKVIENMSECVRRGGFASSVTPVSQFYFQQAYMNTLNQAAGRGTWFKIGRQDAQRHLVVLVHQMPEAADGHRSRFRAADHRDTREAHRRERPAAHVVAGGVSARQRVDIHAVFLRDPFHQGVDLILRHRLVSGTERDDDCARGIGFPIRLETILGDFGEDAGGKEAVERAGRVESGPLKRIGIGSAVERSGRLRLGIVELLPLRRGIHLHARQIERHRQRPAGNIVGQAVRILLPNLEDDLDHPVTGLPHRHHERGIRHERTSARRQLLAQPVDVDAVAGDELRQAVRRHGVAGSAEHIVSGALFGGRAIEALLVFQQFFPHIGRALQGSQLRGELVVDGHRERQHPVGRLAQEAARTLLLPEQGDAAVEIQILAAAAREIVVKDFTGEIHQPLPVEGGHIVVAGQAADEFPAILGDQRMPARRLTGREMIIGVRALLVRTRIYIRFPLVHRDGTGARFGLRLVDPVAVQVEPVVVGPAARPGLRMLEFLAVGVSDGTPVRIDPLRETADPVGIDHRVDQHDIVLQNFLRIGRPGCGQMIG